MSIKYAGLNTSLQPNQRSLVTLKATKAIYTASLWMEEAAARPRDFYFTFLL